MIVCIMCALCLFKSAKVCINSAYPSGANLGKVFLEKGIGALGGAAIGGGVGLLASQLAERLLIQKMKLTSQLVSQFASLRNMLLWSCL